MYNGKKILGLITARGGSKSIPRKNIFPLLGKPLIAYSIEVANKSSLLTRAIVDSDDEEIIEVSKKHGGIVMYQRPKELALDDTQHADVVIHAIAWLKENNGEEFDYVMILQPTSPLRIAEDIDNAIRKAVDTDADSVMSMVKLEDFDPKKLKQIQGDTIVPLFEEEGKTSAFRQLGRKVYKRNCAIYLTKTECIIKRDLFGVVSRPYLMPLERSIDINNQGDFDLAEFYLKKK